MTYDHWLATEPDDEPSLTPAEEAQLDWEEAEEERRAAFALLSDDEKLGVLYNRAHARCKYRDVVCRECGVYPPPEVLYRA